MARIKPYRGKSKERLNAMIRATTVPAIPKDITLLISDTVEQEQGQNTNSKVDVRAVMSHGVSAPITLKYRRLNIGMLKRLPNGELLPYKDIAFPTTVHQILPIINEALGVDLHWSEVINDRVDSIPANGLTIRINENSHAWRAGTHLFGYAPGADGQAARGQDLRIPTDERKRIRVLEKPLSPKAQ